ncbi:MAG: fumarylacetoacetate hydrolase family protein [Sphingomicrobium sp.]
MRAFSPDAHLPSDWRTGKFLGRVDLGEGPSPVLVEKGQLFDMSAVAPTVSLLVEEGKLDNRLGSDLGPIEKCRFELLAPIDFQCVKACGVTFAVSAVERVIEERARGDSASAASLRARLEERIGRSIRAVVPGSDEADRLKKVLIEESLWSQYLEVAIGPDAEVFTKAPVLSTVGYGADVGVRSDSSWNNPEPEIVLVVDSAGKTVGATLGNDVNLRDFEGRSALLLGKAKDNNASCSIGPMIRLFDADFRMDDIRAADVNLRIVGEDGFILNGVSTMSEISRDPLDLVRQTLSAHQYPDGFALFLGTLFAPTQDRGVPGRGFTHATGDVVTIASERLGILVNRVVPCEQAPPWTTGIAAAMYNLARRGLLGV